tara:strand:+ start:1406 stop:2053 length:648 start_codon:yes stop_codon:yes gene_type:complete
MKYSNTFREALNQVREAPDHEISMARGELKATADKALELVAALEGKSDEGNPMEAWVQSKITKAKDYVNSVYDYLMYNPNMANEDFDDINRNRRLGNKTVPTKGTKGISAKDDKEKAEDEVQLLKNKIQKLELALQQAATTLKTTVPNRDTGEVPLRTGIAQALLDKESPTPKLQSKAKKLFTKSLGKTKIEVNPSVDIGIASGGKNTGSGRNLG